MAGRLGDILVDKGYLNEKQLQNALNAQGSERGMLGVLLMNRGLINKVQLGEALMVQFEVPYRELAAETLNPQLVRLLPEKFARQRQVVPITVSSGSMTLAMVAPDDIETICEAELITGYSIEPVVAIQKDIIASLDHGFVDCRLSD
ncbi:MAG: type IV pilus assembly protein PilB [Pirellulaceae bacterium]|jgi:type IV pilus assembly protein PilB